VKYHPHPSGLENPMSFKGVSYLKSHNKTAERFKSAKTAQIKKSNSVLREAYAQWHAESSYLNRPGNETFIKYFFFLNK